MGSRSALLISSSEFQDTALARLAAPHNDVESLAEVLSDPAIGNFGKIKKLVNQPSYVVREAIAKFFSDKKRDDLALLYFSGHGVRDDLNGKLYLTAPDTNRNRLRATGIAARDIQEEMDESRSRRIVLILDCCHSGAFAAGSKNGGIGSSVGTGEAFKGMGYGRVVLTASDALQCAWEDDKVEGAPICSVFTKFLVEGLRTGKADLLQNGKITVDELYDYVYGQIMQLDSDKRQTPGKWSYQQEGEFVLARNQNVKPRPLPKEIQAAVDSPLAEVRLAAVNTLEQLLNSPEQGLARAASDALQNLSDDDSRKVSAAAANVISAFNGTQTRKSASDRPTNKAVEKNQHVSSDHSERKRKSEKLHSVVTENENYKAKSTTVPDAEASVPQKRQTKKTGLCIFVSGLLVACLGVLIYANFAEYRDKAFCTAVEGDANSIAAAIADYFAIPSTVTVGPTPFIVGPNAGKVNGIEFPALSEGNTGKVNEKNDPLIISISVSDASGRCPMEYQKENSGWNNGEGFGVYIKTME